MRLHRRKLSCYYSEYFMETAHSPQHNDHDRLRRRLAGDGRRRFSNVALILSLLRQCIVRNGYRNGPIVVSASARLLRVQSK